jgi:heme O synthase-like polyprenyltransferase
MLPAQTSPRAAARWVLLHTGAAAFAALALAAHPALGWLYLAPVSLATIALLVQSIRLVREPGKRRALALFHTSNIYLAAVMLLVCVDTVVS